jgi:hypothetical protein
VARTDTAHENVTRFFGLSTDTKPTNAMIGATFHETDTRHEFVYDGSWTRDKTVVVEQLATVAAKELLLAKATDGLLAEILTQLKIQNAHLARVTGEELDETDILRGAI